MTPVRVDDTAIRSLRDDVTTKAMLQRVGDAVAADAAAAAPKRSGAMAASIHAEVDEDSEGAYVNISWDNDHFYGLFVELGTSRQSAQPFLRPALTTQRTI